MGRARLTGPEARGLNSAPTASSSSRSSPGSFPKAHLECTPPRENDEQGKPRNEDDLGEHLRDSESIIEPDPDPERACTPTSILPDSAELAPAPASATVEGSSAISDLIGQLEREQLRLSDDSSPFDNPDYLAELGDEEIQDLLDLEDELHGEGGGVGTDDDEEGGISMIWGEELDALYDVDDEDMYEDEHGQGDSEEDEETGEFRFENDGGDMESMSSDEDEDPALSDRRSGETEFGGVEMISPRRMFKGAKNVETVKDCTSEKGSSSLSPDYKLTEARQLSRHKSR